MNTIRLCLLVGADDESLELCQGCPGMMKGSPYLVTVTRLRPPWPVAVVYVQMIQRLVIYVGL